MERHTESEELLSNGNSSIKLGFNIIVFKNLVGFFLQKSQTEMSPWLREHTPLTEDKHSAPIPLLGVTAAYNSSSTGLNARAHTHTQTHAYISKRNI